MSVLKLCSHKLLLIIDTILSFPVNSDIKYVITTNLFTNFEAPTNFYSLINYDRAIFCVEFGGVCHYLAKFTTHDNLMKRLFNYFVTTKMRKNIMCTSESFTAFILRNIYVHVDYTILTFDHNSNKCSIYLLDTNPNRDYSPYIGRKTYFDLKIMYDCATIFYPVNIDQITNDDTYHSTKEHIDSLIDRIIKILSETFDGAHFYTENNSLLY